MLLQILVSNLDPILPWDSEMTLIFCFGLHQNQLKKFKMLFQNFTLQFLENISHHLKYTCLVQDLLSMQKQGLFPLLLQVRNQKDTL